MTGGMMFKGTPGPWSADEYMSGHDGIYIRSESRHWSIAAVHATDGCSDPSRDVSELETAANANLIATAPDLLAALIDVQDFLKRSGYDTKMVKTVIAKALGEQK